MNAKCQHRMNARKQRRWRKDALKDARYNESMAKKERKSGNRILAAGSSREAKVDRTWAGKRKTWANREAKKGK